MNESAKFEVYKKKLQGICDENDLAFRFYCKQYPVKMVISPLGGVGEQMSMLEGAEENGYTSPDATIVFSIKDGDISYKTSKTFTISDALFTKLKNLFKNMHSLWMQFFFRDIMERHVLEYCKVQMPEIPDEDLGESCDEGLEEELMDEDGRLEPPEDSDDDE